jgi:hypothetical protein
MLSYRRIQALSVMQFVSTGLLAGGVACVEEQKELSAGIGASNSF